MIQIKDRLYSLDWLRAFFCISVVLFHTRFALGQEEWLGQLLHRAFAKLYVAVDLFFVLSGFVIHYQYRDAYCSFRTFLLKRFVRTVPMYWILTVVAILIDSNYRSALIHRTHFMMNWIIKSLIFVPLEAHEAHWGAYPVLLPAWMLPALFYCYLLYACGFHYKKIERVLLLTFFGIVGVYLPKILSISLSTIYVGTVGSPFVLEFCLGSLLAEMWRLYQRKLSRNVLPSGIVIIVLLSVFMILATEGGHGLFSSGFTMGLIMLSCLLMETLFSIRRFAWIESISHVSYVVFLSHIMLWSFWDQHISSHPQSFVYQALEYISLLLFIILINCALFIKIESKLSKWLVMKFNL